MKKWVCVVLAQCTYVTLIRRSEGQGSHPRRVSSRGVVRPAPPTASAPALPRRHPRCQKRLARWSPRCGTPSAPRRARGCQKAAHRNSSQTTAVTGKRKRERATRGLVQRDHHCRLLLSYRNRRSFSEGRIRTGPSPRLNIEVCRSSITAPMPYHVQYVCTHGSMSPFHYWRGRPREPRALTLECPLSFRSRPEPCRTPATVTEHQKHENIQHSRSFLLASTHCERGDRLFLPVLGGPATCSSPSVPGYVTCCISLVRPLWSCIWYMPALYFSPFTLRLD